MRIILPLFIFFLSCSPNNDVKERVREESHNIEDVNIQNAEELNTEKEQETIYEVAVVDSIKGHIQRLFVVIAEDSVFDVQFIRKVVCNLNEDYDLDIKSAISFFTERKYANYYTEVFKSIGAHIELSPSEKQEYKNWKKSYYLGEFDNETREYATYPSSGDSKKMEDFQIEPCE